jgi:large subunit ribosomal protein L17
MAMSLFQHGAIRTTEPKAKEYKGFVEKLITMARRGTLQARRQVLSVMRDRLMADDEGEIQDKTVVQKLFDEIAPRYSDRPGGYTRIIRLSDRRIGDAGVQVLLQLVEAAPAAGAAAKEGARSSRRRRQAGKRRERLESAQAQKPAQAPSEETSPAAPSVSAQTQAEEKPKE